MSKYIDADKLIAEIKRLKDKYPSWQLKFAMDDLCGFIDSLQQEQPEVDLEKEITRFFNQLAIDESLQDGVSISKFDLVRIARHFFELGLNARKEE